MEPLPDTPLEPSSQLGATARARRRTSPTVAAIIAVAALRTLAGTLHDRARRRGDRGDVPGWVLVTLMTAGLVTALWVLARDRLVEVFDRAITSVSGTSATG